jgi:hypothetical protein
MIKDNELLCLKSKAIAPNDAPKGSCSETNYAQLDLAQSGGREFLVCKLELMPNLQPISLLTVSWFLIFF